MTVVLSRVGYSISGSEMTVLRYLILEQIFSHDEHVLNWGILSVINLNDNFCGGHLMDSRGPQSCSLVMERPSLSSPKILNPANFSPVSCVSLDGRDGLLGCLLL